MIPYEAKEELIELKDGNFAIVKEPTAIEALTSRNFASKINAEDDIVTTEAYLTALCLLGFKEKKVKENGETVFEESRFPETIRTIEDLMVRLNIRSDIFEEIMMKNIEKNRPNEENLKK